MSAHAFGSADLTQEREQGIAKVTRGSLRWQVPVDAANSAEEILIQRIMQEKVAKFDIITTSLQSHFWSLISSDTNAEKAGVAFAKAMNQLSQDGRGVVHAMTTPDTRSRRGADSLLRSSLGMLITEISESQKIMRNGSYR
jgi:hypothetical protein